MKFHTQTDVFLHLSFNAANGALTIYGVPNTAGGDLDELVVSSSGSASGTRSVTSFFRTLADQSVTLGPPQNTPTYTIAATAPYVRYRAQLAVQPEYGALAEFFFRQSTSPTHIQIWMVDVTAGYAGGTWDVQIPDLSSVAAFAAAGMQVGVTTSAIVTTTSARPALYLGAIVAAGETFRTGTRSTTLLP